ncbi:MAG: hypothetical protein H0U64_05215 [Gemmatimonadaceae bacterium]|nr:hypothetical protein [Gemmatimonadaceae bacterium]
MQVFVGGGNAIFLLLTVLFTGFLALVGLVAWRDSNRTLFRAATGVAGVVIGVYGALLLTAGLASKERVLSQGEVKWFCGFYLDCHLGVSVDKVESAKSLPGANGPVVAKGIFRIITLRFHNSARNPDLDMTIYRPRSELVDARGGKYLRSPEAEIAATRNRSFSPVLDEQLSVGHSPVLATVVFDTPFETPEPRLRIEEGFIVDRVIELLLVNDDNSLLHQPAFLALNKSRAWSPTSFLRNVENMFPRVRLASR